MPSASAPSVAPAIPARANPNSNGSYAASPPILYAQGGKSKAMPATLTMEQFAPTSLTFADRCSMRSSHGGRSTSKYIEASLNGKRWPLVQLSALSAPLRAPFGDDALTPIFHPHT